MKYQYCLVACARWETAYIVEWLIYHQALGFDHVFLYCNDDDPAALFEQVLPFTRGKEPFVTFRYFPHQGQQHQMYAHFLVNDLSETEWVSFLDVDEFMRLPFSMKFHEFLGNFDKNVDCILFNWIFFGPNGHKSPPKEHVLSAYTRREANLHPFTKFIARARILEGVALLDRNCSSPPAVSSGFGRPEERLT